MFKINYIRINSPEIYLNPFEYQDLSGTGIIPYGQTFPDEPNINLKVYANGKRLSPFGEYVLNYSTLDVEILSPHPVGIFYLIERT